MKVKTIFILLFAIMVVIITIIFQKSSNQEISSQETAVNLKIIQTKSFSVNSVSSNLNTTAKGTIFIKGTQGRVEQVQIIASIEIDPNDWGGVAFYIPHKWHISNIMSSYPENKTQSKPADYVSTWTTTDTENEWKAWIEVGRDRSYRPTGGGTGTVVIDLIPDQNTKKQPESFKFTVEVGSNVKDGVKIMGTDFISVPISLTEKE